MRGIQFCVDILPPSTNLIPKKNNTAEFQIEVRYALQILSMGRSLLSFLKSLSFTRKGDGGNTASDSKSSNHPIVLARLPSRFLPDDAQSISSDNDLYGLIHFTVHNATLLSQSKGKSFFVTVSIGKQTLTSKSVHISASTPHLDEVQLPPWNVSSEFVLRKTGATVMKISVFRQGTLENRLEAFCEVDLASYFKSTLVQEEGNETSNVIQDGNFDLFDPVESTKVVGRIHLSGKAAHVADLEKQVWNTLFSLADWDHSGTLTEEEFGLLLQALGTDLSDEKLRKIFSAVDKDSSGTVNLDELSSYLALEGDSFTELVRRCPVDGAELSSDRADSASNIIYVWMALSATMMEASDLDKYDTQGASSAWMLRLSDWASHPVDFPKPTGVKLKKNPTIGGLRIGHAAAHIMVYNREERRVEEEKISPMLSLAIRTMYQSKFGRVMMKQARLEHRLPGLSVREGKYRDTEESAKDIRPFVDSFRGQIDMVECEKSIDKFKTFNDFFYRKLKPGSRPVADAENADVITSAADCRLQVYENLDEATRFWIKGKNFSIAGLLGDTDPDKKLSKKFSHGTMAIFRLAPQDYHRFHSPVDGTILSFHDIPGDLLTVNPIAVNSIFCDVFTVNKRSVALIKTPTFGEVAFVAIGATLVGSIVWTTQIDQTIRKGDELGYFAFGGSTCIVLFPDGQDVVWDGDLTTNSHRSLESLVKVGERIGCRKGTDADAAPAREALIERTSTVADEAGITALEDRPELEKLLSGKIDGFISPCESLAIE